LNRLSGRDAIINTDKPNQWFGDDEIAVRLYRNIENYELAIYGYRGFWKSPGGMNTKGEAIFPDLNVYGSSVRGSIGRGVGNMELGYYQSADNESGNDPLINNSELRFLIGYSQEIAKEFTAGLQYYIEHMLDYENYHDNRFVSPRQKSPPDNCKTYQIIAEPEHALRPVHIFFTD